MIQSLLTQEEYNKCSLRYNTYNVKFRKYTTPMREVEINGEKRLCGPPPCYRMGDSFTATEMQTFNNELDKMKLRAGLFPKHDTNRSGDGNFPGLPFHP